MTTVWSVQDGPSSTKESSQEDYGAIFREFDTPLMRKIREEAYGEDIGQHSWVTADELREDAARLRLTESSRLLDLGCGPGGPLVFLAQRAHCRATGIEISADALGVARARARAARVDHHVELKRMDLNGSVDLPDRFDAVICYDVVLHVHDRTQLFSVITPLLARGGTFLFTDAGVLTGSISNEQMMLRSMHGLTQIAAAGFNERALEDAGLRLIETEDRTSSLLRNAAGRMHARNSYREQLQKIEGAENFARQQRYLETVLALSRDGSLSRRMYRAERG